MHRFARRMQKQDAKLENEALEEPKAKKSRSDNRTSKIANMDNGTMVEAFKYLNYCQLAKNSLVSKRFRNVIKTHRHKLALLCVDIRMERFSGIDCAAIKLFNKEISSEEYNEWVALNNYSKQTSTICQAAGDCQGYKLTAYGDYKDPFICIRYLALIPQPDVLKLLAAIIEHNNRGRLQCETLDFDFEGDVQESFSWVKDHVRCANFEIAGSRSSPDHDKQLLDFFATGSHCTSEVFAFHDISKAVIVDFVQKFMDLKSRDDSQLVESIGGYVSKLTANELTTNYEKFFIEGKYENRWNVATIFELVNADIAKKLQLTISYSYRGNQVILKIINL
ncbi:hypothetical protein DdX_21900 [Ditylenchus destructor]|uniref:F-box domain-containing protein n=1 Tax=Ditylenchus destructor TaxID=166010 RepID=A0AAD4QST8_9BILA|nr:hypothetical protein DdX_21900 [Ditylenchus destructor]